MIWPFSRSRNEPAPQPQSNRQSNGWNSDWGGLDDSRYQQAVDAECERAWATHRPRERETKNRPPRNTGPPMIPGGIRERAYHEARKRKR
jgi:hypothetical protein